MCGKATLFRKNLIHDSCGFAAAFRKSGEDGGIAAEIFSAHLPEKHSFSAHRRAQPEELTVVL